jgi:hypothetical protein
VPTVAVMIPAGAIQSNAGVQSLLCLFADLCKASIALQDALIGLKVRRITFNRTRFRRPDFLFPKYRIKLCLLCSTIWVRSAPEKRTIIEVKL